MEGPLERDHAGPLRVRARELDRVLDRLGAGVEEGRLRRARERRDRDQPLGELDVDLVRHDREVRVREARELLLRGFDDSRVRVPDVQAADAAGEVDERIAVDVCDRRAAALRREDGMDERKRSGDHALLALGDLARARAGELGSNLDRLGHGHGLVIQDRAALCIDE